MPLFLLFCISSTHAVCDASSCEDHGPLILGVTSGILAFIWLGYHAAVFARSRRAQATTTLSSDPETSQVANPVIADDIELGKKSAAIKDDGDKAINSQVEAAMEKTMKSEAGDAKDLVGGTSAVHQWMSGGGSGGFWSMAYIVINFFQNFTLVSLFEVSWPVSWSLSIRFFDFSTLDISIAFPTIVKNHPEFAKWISFLLPLLFHPLLIARFDNGLFRRMKKDRSERILKQLATKEA